MTQVGIIVAEIGLGFRYLALVHILGHACLRTLQLLRAPSLLRDYSDTENAIGSRLPAASGFWSRLLPHSVHQWCYRFAFERGYLDASLYELVVAPLLRVFKWCDAMERKWTDFLSQAQSRESDRVKPAIELTEDLT
jgi:NADH-quinone oxidoreductase subunit L